MDKTKKEESGVGILDVIVALSILSTGLVAILAMANSFLKTAQNLENMMSAAFLAQEAIETIRYTREVQTSWDDWYASIDTTPTSYNIQYDTESLPLPGYTETPLKLSNGRYQYDSGSPTIFYRKVTLTKSPEGDADEVKVEVEIKWPLANDWQTMVVEDRLWNWR